jgi:hypothetical protein
VKALERIAPDPINLRQWSNDELRKFAPLFIGRVVNVSAWEDRDKGGSFYKNYFFNARDYSITNYPGPRGVSNLPGEIRLDLTAPLPDQLRGAFDVVYNHSTLEHIYEVKEAFANLCAMSRDVVILVVPFIYHTHGEPGLGDFWRFTPEVLRILFHENGFETLYESAPPAGSREMYVFSIASKDPEKWKGKIPYRLLPESNLGAEILPRESRLCLIKQYLRRYL